MATRTLVKCKSQSIPGDPQFRDKEMAKIICTHILGRDFDDCSDTFLSMGQYAADDIRLYCLVDSGPRESKNPEVSVYRWDGAQFNSRPATPSIIAYLQRFPFRPKMDGGLTDDEYRETYGEEELEKIQAQRVEQKQRWGSRLLPGELLFLEKHPEIIRPKRST